VRASERRGVLAQMVGNVDLTAQNGRIVPVRFGIQTGANNLARERRGSLRARRMCVHVPVPRDGSRMAPASSRTAESAGASSTR
jgi:hypothetical protein